MIEKGKAMKFEDMLRQYVAEQAALTEPPKPAKVPAKRARRYHSTRELTVDEKRTILEMKAAGYGVDPIARHIGRRSPIVREVIIAAKKAIEKAAAAKVTPVPVADPVDVSGLGSLKRSVERLHDRVSKLTNSIESITHQLAAITSTLSKVQSTSERIMREFVDTNPPPSEMHFGRNGQVKT